MKKKRQWLWVAVIVGMLGVASGAKKFLKFAGDYPQEATWGVVFYGMIALPVGLVAWVLYRISKDRKNPGDE